MKDDKRKLVPVLFQTLSNIDILDTRFTKVKIWLMHLEENFNGSYFTEESVVQAIPTLANTPIMGLIEEESKDFTDHGVELEINLDNGEIKERHLTVPYGVIPSENNAQFEERVGDDGVTRKYLTVEGILWNKWEDAIKLLNDGKPKGQSMEIIDVEGKFNKEGFFDIFKFKFDGACILGDDVLPAMINSTIETKFSSTVTNVIQEKLNVYNTYAKGGNEVPNNEDKKMSKDNKNTESNNENKKVEKVSETGDDKKPENASKPNANKNDKDVAKKDEDAKKRENPDANRRISSGEASKDVPDKETSADSEGGVLGQIIIGKNVYTKEDVEELVEIQEKYEALVKEQRINEAKEQINKFADLLTEEQINGLNADLESKDVEELTKEIYAFVGLNSINNKPKEEEEQATQFTKVGVTVKSESDDPYGNIIRKK